MEPIKFEDNIREKLQEREMTPSIGSWEKLESKINPTITKKSYKSKWFAIAAGFVGILIIASFIFNDDITNLENDVKIVEGSLIENKLEEKIATQVVAETEKDNLTIESSVVEENILESKNESIKEHSKFSNGKTSKEEIAILDTKESLNTADGIADDEGFTSSKIEDERIAQLEMLENKNQSVSDDDIDALLSIAQKDIQSQRTIPNIKVDATVLLNAVESEMETTFRDKVFEAIGDGYEKVRTAVVEKNK